MIFTARDLLVSLAFFALLYCPLSSLVVLAWRSMAPMCRKSMLPSANFLFGLRIFSFAVSTAVAVFFTFPSFWLMERPSLDEDSGTFILAACALVILSAGLFRVLRAQARTTSAVKQWSSRARGIGNAVAAPALNASNGAPALILVGIRRPRVMVSDMAAVVLSDHELQVAIRHELGHRRSWDNLKKVLISATPFPGMGSIENAWREAAELAADDSAVTNRQEALDLAAALIKLSLSSKQWSEPALASGLVNDSSSISLRVQRLLQWRKTGRRLRQSRPWPLFIVLFAIVFAISSNYGATLALTHRLTELLVP